MTFLEVDISHAIWNILHVSLIILCPIFFFLQVAVESITSKIWQIFPCINSGEFHFHSVSSLMFIELIRNYFISTVCKGLHQTKKTAASSCIIRTRYLIPRNSKLDFWRKMSFRTLKSSQSIVQCHD